MSGKTDKTKAINILDTSQELLDFVNAKSRDLSGVARYRFFELMVSIAEHEKRHALAQCSLANAAVDCPINADIKKFED